MAMLTARFDEVFLVPVRRVKAKAKPRASSKSTEELEFSDYGRDPHQSAGWVILGILGFWAAATAFLVFAV
jgi:hypothetical protein